MGLVAHISKYAVSRETERNELMGYETITANSAPDTSLLFISYPKTVRRIRHTDKASQRQENILCRLGNILSGPNAIYHSSEHRSGFSIL